MKKLRLNLICDLVFPAHTLPVFLDKFSAIVREHFAALKLWRQ